MKRREASEPRDLKAEIGAQVLRFQAGTSQVDKAAAQVLALEDTDLGVISLLWFAGPMNPSELATRASLKRSALGASLSRLTLAGYTLRGTAETAGKIELTLHARRWIETIWGPLQLEGARVCDGFTPTQLRLVVSFLVRACEVQEKHAARLRAQLEIPGRASAPNRARGGLAPASLRRVQLFVEANLEKPLTLADLAARAELSTFHFARAFKASLGLTPRAFLEQRRILRAKRLMRETNWSLSQIALETGLGSQSRMTTAFRKATGATPARYRRASSPAREP